MRRLATCSPRMNPTMRPPWPDELERLAHKRAAARLGWIVHAAVYVLVSLLLWALSSQGFGNRPWSVYPLLGWGLGLALHGAAVFLRVEGSAWHGRLLERERERLRRTHQRLPRP